MLGAIAGDVIGSVYERYPIKTPDFPLFSRNSTFTDDTVLTVAVAYAILNGLAYGPIIKEFGRRYPDAGYGESFRRWLQQPGIEPYNSWGNGSAMRVSPVGYAFQNEDRVLEEARKSAVVSHSHPEGIKGAQATALAIYLARTGSGKAEIRAEIEARFDYNLGRALDEIRPDYQFDVSPRVRSLNRSAPSWSRRVLRTVSERRSRWEAMPIRWPASLAPSRRRTMAQYRSTSLLRHGSGYPQSSAVWWKHFTTDTRSNLTAARAQMPQPSST